MFQSRDPRVTPLAVADTFGSCDPVSAETKPGRTEPPASMPNTPTARNAKTTLIPRGIFDAIAELDVIKY